MALGAGSAQVLRLVVGEGMCAALIGMAIGLPGVYLVGKTLKSLLYNVVAMDVRALIGVALALLASESGCPRFLKQNSVTLRQRKSAKSSVQQRANMFPSLHSSLLLECDLGKSLVFTSMI